MFPSTFHFLNSDNPMADRNWFELMYDKSKNPAEFVRASNDMVAWFRYEKIKKDIDANTNLSSIEKRNWKTSVRHALMDMYPGFQQVFGDSPSYANSKVRFDEMVDKWLTSDWALSQEAGAGFAKFYEYWAEAEKISLEEGGSTTWWLTSTSEEAFVLRKRVSQATFDEVIPEYPDFYSVYMNVIIRLWAEDREVLDYNTMLSYRRRQYGDMDK